MLAHGVMYTYFLRFIVEEYSKQFINLKKSMFVFLSVVIAIYWLIFQWIASITSYVSINQIICISSYRCHKIKMDMVLVKDNIKI